MGGLFNTRLLERGDREFRREGWATSARELPRLGRPGRCAANIEFVPLSAEEATAWLAAHGTADGQVRSATLAELYAQAEGRDPTDMRLVGFGDDER